jgi:hypothetical protein
MADPDRSTGKTYPSLPSVLVVNFNVSSEWKALLLHHRCPSPLWIKIIL